MDRTALGTIFQRERWIIGGCLLFAGYYWAMLTGRPKSVSEDIVRFRRREQMIRLKKLFGKLLGRSQTGGHVTTSVIS